MGLLGHCFNWALLGESPGLLFKKENIEDGNKVAAVGHRRQQKEFGWIREGGKMIWRPFSPIRSSENVSDSAGNQPASRRWRGLRSGDKGRRRESWEEKGGEEKEQTGERQEKRRRRRGRRWQITSRAQRVPGRPFSLSSGFSFSPSPVRKSVCVRPNK